ncbi:Chaperone protein DnaJ [Bienertia sinuspersici]
MENITASEVAGFGVGTFLLCATIAAPKVDAFISSSQRSSLGMCKKCGDVKLIACKKCKGSGLVKTGGLFGLGNPLDDMFLGRFESKEKPVSCVNCGAKGHFPCPECNQVCVSSSNESQ